MTPWPNIRVHYRHMYTVHVFIKFFQFWVGIKAIIRDSNTSNTATCNFKYNVGSVKQNPPRDESTCLYIPLQLYTMLDKT